MKRTPAVSFVFAATFAFLALASSSIFSGLWAGGTGYVGISKNSQSASEWRREQEKAEEIHYSNQYKALEKKEAAAEKRRIQGHMDCKADPDCEKRVQEQFEAEELALAQEKKLIDEEHERKMEAIAHSQEDVFNSNGNDNGTDNSTDDGQDTGTPGNETDGGGVVHRTPRPGPRPNPRPQPHPIIPRPTPTRRPIVPRPTATQVPSPSQTAPTPPPAPPHPVICTLHEIAQLVFERYNTGEPIRIVRIGNRPNTYMMLLSGTEKEQPDQATLWVEDFLETKPESPSLYRLWVKYALKAAHLPRGSKLIIAAHSLGGMVAQNLMLDQSLRSDLGIQPERLILFGVPNVAPRVNGTRYIYVEHVGDHVLNLFNREHKIFGLALPPPRGRIRIGGDFKEVKVEGGNGTPDFWGYHNLYDQTVALNNYDPQGDSINSNSRYECLLLDLSFSRSFTAPNQSHLQSRFYESIGELGMEKKADELHYRQLLAPSQASNRPQGYDGVYWDPKTETIVIGEAKGGNAQLGWGYGFRQGTIGWAKGAARATWRSRTANDREVGWAQMILYCLGQRTNSPNINRRFPVRVELFSTKEFPGPTTHQVLSRYP